MRTPLEEYAHHAAEAEQLLAEAALDKRVPEDHLGQVYLTGLLSSAQVHATLAVAAATIVPHAEAQRAAEARINLTRMGDVG